MHLGWNPPNLSSWLGFELCKGNLIPLDKVGMAIHKLLKLQEPNHILNTSFYYIYRSLYVQLQYMYSLYKRAGLKIELWLILMSSDVCEAVGHKGNLPLMNQISKGICPPLNMSQIKFEIVCFCPWWTKFHGGHRGQTPQIVFP